METLVHPPSVSDAEPVTRLAKFETLSTSPKLVNEGQEIELSENVYEALRNIIEALNKGCIVSITPLSTILTTAQAAELLNVSRPHVVKLADEKQIPHHRVGAHRRLALTDVLAYRAKRDESRREALTEMHRIADDDDMSLLA